MNQHDNSMLPRTTGAIELRPTGNAQGEHYFYSLTTGKRLHRTQRTELPMPADVIVRVHKLSRRELALTLLEFSDRAGVLIPDKDDDLDDDDDDDDNFDPNDDPIDEDVDNWIDGQIAGVDDEGNIGNEEDIGNEDEIIDEIIENEETDNVVDTNAPNDNTNETGDEVADDANEMDDDEIADDGPPPELVPRIAAIGHVTELGNEETADEVENEEAGNEEIK